MMPQPPWWPKRGQTCQLAARGGKGWPEAEATDSAIFISGPDFSFPPTSLLPRGQWLLISRLDSAECCLCRKWRAGAAVLASWKIQGLIIISVSHYVTCTRRCADHRTCINSFNRQEQLSELGAVFILILLMRKLRG